MGGRTTDIEERTMSDEDEDSNSEDEEEEDEEGSDDNASGSGDGDEANKKDLVLEDISTIKDIFSYIDQTSKRIVSKFDTERELRRKNDFDRRRQNLEDMDTPDISWSQYENLDDAQRAQLLEKAIMVLGQETR